jgi:ABC-2 type transport system permease protein
VLFFLVELLRAPTALGIGVVLSLFADNGFQAIQFVPVVIMPQVVLGGTFLSVEQLPWYLEYSARVMPVTSIIEAMGDVVLGAGDPADFRLAMAALGGSASPRSRWPAR